MLDDFKADILINKMTPARKKLGALAHTTRTTCKNLYQEAILCIVEENTPVWDRMRTPL